MNGWASREMSRLETIAIRTRHDSCSNERETNRRNRGETNIERVALGRRTSRHEYGRRGQRLGNRNDKKYRANARPGIAEYGHTEM